MTQTPPESGALFTAEQVIAMVQKMNTSLGGKVAKVEIVPATATVGPRLRATMGDGTAAELGIPQQDVAALQESIQQAVTGITVTDDGEMTVAKGDGTTANYAVIPSPTKPSAPSFVTMAADGSVGTSPLDSLVRDVVGSTGIDVSLNQSGQVVITNTSTGGGGSTATTTQATLDALTGA